LRGRARRHAASIPAPLGPSEFHVAKLTRAARFLRIAVAPRCGLCEQLTVTRQAKAVQMTVLMRVLSIVGLTSMLTLAPGAAAAPAFAQIGGTGSIRGTVLDSSGAILPGATINATNIATGVTTTRQSTDAGAYLISPLPPGEYKVTVTLDGFQTFVQEHVIVDALATSG
jgi:hypothetical protein